MSHIVIHNNSDYVAQYRQFDDVQDAVTYLEQLHNADDVKGARLFAMQEVSFEVKSYVRVELGSAGAVTAPAAPAPAPARAVVPEVIAPSEVAQEVETVSYIEASLASVDEVAPVAPARDVSESEHGSSDVRRGLFGR